MARYTGFDGYKSPRPKERWMRQEHRLLFWKSRQESLWTGRFFHLPGSFSTEIPAFSCLLKNWLPKKHLPNPEKINNLPKHGRRGGGKAPPGLRKGKPVFRQSPPGG